VHAAQRSRARVSRNAALNERGRQTTPPEFICAEQTAKAATVIGDHFDIDQPRSGHGRLAEDHNTRSNDGIGT
jgi:hypothetical protein